MTTWDRPFDLFLLHLPTPPRTTQPAGWIAPSIHHTRPYDVITSLYRRECEGVSRNRRALLLSSVANALRQRCLELYVINTAPWFNVCFYALFYAFFYTKFQD